MALTKEAREYFAREGRKGGKATAKNRTPEERRKAAQKAIQARWAKQEKKLETVVESLTEGTQTLLRKAKRPKP